MKDKLQRIKERELDILKDFKRVCNKKNIKYFLAFGTLLGAVRHKGFIPWDDDIDVMMTRKEYNKFLKCSKELSEDIFLQNNSTDSFKFGIFLTAKLRDNNSKIEFDVVHHPGIFVDIFVIDGLPEGETEMSTKKKYIKLRYMESIEYDPNFFNKRKILIPFISIRWILRSIKLCERIRENYIKSTIKDESQYFMYWGTPLQMNKSDIYPTKEIMFEGNAFPIPNNYKKFLETIYGDYNKLPPVNERKPIHVNLETAEIN